MHPSSLADRSVQSNLNTKIGRRSYASTGYAWSWEELWEAGPYFERVSELLEDARDHVILTGWQIDSRLKMPRPDREKPASLSHPAHPMESLRDKLVRLCERNPGLEIFILIWDHAYLYCAERELWQGRVWDEIHPRVHFVFDNQHLGGGAHHEKILIVDGRVALTGGIDLCDERYDTPSHLYYDPRRSLDGGQRGKENHGPYHDMAVQVSGPVCALLQEHVASRWRQVSTLPFPKSRSFGPAASCGYPVHVSRTIAPIDGVSITREVEFLFRDLIREARSRIILEGQYYWSSELHDLLVAKMHEMRGRDFELVLIVADLRGIKSLTRKMAGYENQLLRSLSETARFTGTRLVLGGPVVEASEPGLPPRPVYIHSKLVIIDDRYLSVGSTNLATRALRLDTEIQLTRVAETDADRAHIRRVADYVFEHWNVDGRAPLRPVHLRPLPLPVAKGPSSRSTEMLDRVLPIFFDPIIPWSMPLKRRWRRLRMLTFVTILIIGAILSAALSGGATAGTALYGLVLSSAWLLPVPFALTAVLSVVHLGAETGARLGVAGLWISTTFAYVFYRSFPRRLGRLERPDLARSALGASHHFASMLAWLFSPRRGVHEKIVGLSLNHAYFPWYALAAGLLLPSATWVFLRWIVPEALNLIPWAMPGMIAGLAIAWASRAARLRGSHARQA